MILSLCMVQNQGSFIDVLFCKMLIQLETTGHVLKQYLVNHLFYFVTRMEKFSPESCISLNMCMTSTFKTLTVSTFQCLIYVKLFETLEQLKLSIVK